MRGDFHRGCLNISGGRSRLSRQVCIFFLHHTAAQYIFITRMGFRSVYFIQKKYDSEDTSFLLDIVSGCIEQKKVLDVVVNTFYDHHGKLELKADHNQFSGK